MDKNKIKLIAFDLDGTLTQHRTPIDPVNREALEKLAENHRLVMVGAGNANRIHKQLEYFPIDVIGNYGMEEGVYNKETKVLDIVSVKTCFPLSEEEVRRRINILREEFRCGAYAGDYVEIHASGMLTFPMLGTKADIKDKLAYDPDRSKRRPLFPRVREMFPEYTTFIGGSSSFDIVPLPYNKLHALKAYCEKYGYTAEETAFFGDDYREGGNDAQVYNSEFNFITVDDYRTFPEKAAILL